MLNFKIDIQQVKEIVRKRRFMYESEISKIDATDNINEDLNVNMYVMHSKELQYEILKKLEELDIPPDVEDENEIDKPSSLVIRVGGFFRFLFGFGTKGIKEIYTAENSIKNARAGYVFNVFILITLIVLTILILYLE